MALEPISNNYNKGLFRLQAIAANMFCYNKTGLSHFSANARSIFLRVA